MKTTKSVGIWVPGMNEVVMVPLQFEMTKSDLDFYEKFWSGWTPTAIELWNDKKFIEKRIEEQSEYMALLESEQFSDRCTRTRQRFDELYCIAWEVKDRFEDRLKELNGDVAELVHAPS